VVERGDMHLVLVEKVENKMVEKKKIEKSWKKKIELLEIWMDR